MLLDIITYPDKRLKTISEPVEKFDKNLGVLLDDMYETMIAKNGIGLAAIQVGVPKRVLIVNIPDENDEIDEKNKIDVINPEILEASGEAIYKEGCLSVPDFYEEVQRPSDIVVRFYNRHGEEQILEAQDLLAVALQHEIDHLNGRIFVEKIPMLKRKKFEKEWKNKK